MIDKEPKRIALVLNPFAGSGRGIELATQVIARLQEINISCHLFREEWPADFEGYSDIWIFGGDGTLNYFINRYPGIELPMMIFKGGSGNDFHWLLYKDASLDKMIGKGLTGNINKTDAGLCNGKLFINGVGVGFDGAVANSLAGKDKKAGKRSFLFVIIQKIFFFKEQEYSISTEDFDIREKLLMINVMNGKRAGGGFYITPTSEANDGLLEVNMIKPLSVVNRLRFLPVIEKGKHIRKSFANYFTTNKIIIETNVPAHAHVDGEYFSARHFEIEILPGKFLFRY